MKKSAPKQASTQKFIEIESVTDNIVFFQGQHAALIIEVTATNFSLLSKEEQDAKVASYVAFLNSLSFPIQIFIRNKQLDISSYIMLLQTQETQEQNPIVKERIKLYKDFVSNLVKVNVVLDKRFYIVVYFSYLEKGIEAAASAVKNKGNAADFQINAKTGLHTKSQAIQSQLQSLNLKTKVLEKKELIQLFYEAYNSDSVPTGQVTQSDSQAAKPQTNTL